MAIRPVRDLGGFGQLANTILDKRALEQAALDKERAFGLQESAGERATAAAELQRRVTEGQLTTAEDARTRAGQRSELERSLAGIFAGAEPVDGVGPPIPGEILGERGAATIAESPVGTLEDIERFFKVADPTRAAGATKPSPFQFGAGNIVKVGEEFKQISQRRNPNTGEVETVVSDLPAGAVPTFGGGETPAERQKREAETAGGKAQAVADVDVVQKPIIKAAVTRAELETKIELEPDLEKKKTLQRDAAQAAEKNIVQLAKTEQNIRNYDNAIKAVQGGAKTGTVTRLFPSFRESSILLDQMQAELGLDVVGSVTFGALSKGELDLAKEVALPTNLDGPELIQWIEAKRDVQIKMASILREASIFLSQPGNTRADWLQRNGAATIPREQAGVTGQGEIPNLATPTQPQQIPGMPEGFTIERVQ